MGVHLQLDIDRCPQTLKNRQRTERFHDAQRIGEAKPPCPGNLGSLGGTQQKILIGPRSIFATDNDFQPPLSRLGHTAANGRQRLFAKPAQLVLELLVGQRDREVHAPHAEIAAQPQIGFAHPTPHEQSSVQIQPGQIADAIPLFLTHCRNADFQFRHAQCVEFTGDGALFLLCEGDSRRLLPITEGSVVDHDRARSNSHGGGLFRRSPS